MSDDQVTIEIDGKSLKAAKGEMLIAVADREGIYIPRFCYHEKLSIAANCRMCLVEVEKAPKPMPACATPVMDGMKVMTDSPRALSAQKATMEFLLINHPLDCPVCDQGGECELQDLAMGFGSAVSRFIERKRAVQDKSIGPLISTDMTRCIHCTRCVRFGQEVSGIQELGGLGRGENLQIGTFIENSVDHELSGNVIDLCPVGALNSKPFRMRGRSWEMLQHAMIAPHDAAGSNLYGHTLRGKFMRVVPRENEQINETWLSDRDRFSYEGIHSEQRLLKPMVKSGGKWQEASWDDALQAAAKLLADIAQQDTDQLGVLASPSSTLEELHLLNRVAEGLGTSNIDHRLRQVDFSLDDAAPLFPSLGRSIESLDALDAAVIIGSNLRHDVPIVAHRIRKAAMRGAKIGFINPRAYEFLFPVHAEAVVSVDAMTTAVAALLKAVCDKSGKKVPAAFSKLAGNSTAAAAADGMAEALLAAGNTALILGDIAEAHPEYATLQRLAAAIADIAGSTWGVLSAGANSAGAQLVGVHPSRGIAGSKRARPGRNAHAMLAEPRAAYLLSGVEAELDCWDGAQAVAALESAKVVMLTSFASETMKQYADVLLPIGTLAETYGSYINAEGRLQTMNGASSPLGDARPAWKVLRVLGNLLHLEGFDYMQPTDVTQEIREQLGEIRMNNALNAGDAPVLATPVKGLLRVAETALYGSDPLVRRADSLQHTELAKRQRAVHVASEDAARLSIADGDTVRVSGTTGDALLTAIIDSGIPAGTIFVASGIAETAMLGARIGAVELKVEANTARERAQ